MTNAEMNALIAEKVMGWTLRDWEDGPDEEWWADTKGKYVDSPETWQPLTDPAQAVQALETFCARDDVRLEQIGLLDGPTWFVVITIGYGGDTRTAEGEGSFCAAICDALAEAVQA